LGQEYFVNYDPQIIIDFAGALYARAEKIVFAYTLRGIVGGVLLGGPIGAALGAASGATPLSVGLFCALLFGALGGYAGYSAGQEKAFALKLQAQTALCQVQIEANTQPLTEPEEAVEIAPRKRRARSSA
jgi:hypothetical protein